MHWNYIFLALTPQHDAGNILAILVNITPADALAPTLYHQVIPRRDIHNIILQILKVTHQYNTIIHTVW